MYILPYVVLMIIYVKQPFYEKISKNTQNKINTFGMKESRIEIFVFLLVSL